MLRWMDALCEGPVPHGRNPDEFRAVRADWLAARYGLDRDKLLQRLADQDDALETAAAGADEVVLWLEPGLFDQIVLIALVDRLWPRVAGRLSLICTDRLTATDPAELFPRRRRLTEEHADLALRAWNAFTAASPEPLNDMVGSTGVLPVLTAALDRHRRQYPWRSDGLSMSERLALDAIARGAVTPHAMFTRIQAREPVSWQAKAMVEAVLRDLAAEPLPLVADKGDLVQLTEAGRAVLDGKRDGLAGRTRDRWLGGAHLAGEAPNWRWDDRAHRVVVV